MLKDFILNASKLHHGGLLHVRESRQIKMNSADTFYSRILGSNFHNAPGTKPKG